MKTITLNLFLAITLLFITVPGYSFNLRPTSENWIKTPQANETRTIVPTDTTSVAFGDSKLFLELDGISGYADTSQLLSGLNKATLMGWIKVNPDMTSNGFIMGQDNLNLKIAVNGSNRALIATAKNQSVAFPQNLSANRWYHITVVYDNLANDKLALYVNGKKEAASASPELSEALTTSSAKFTMGKNPVSPSEYFKGAIDEVRVFNVALADDMIQKMVYQEIKQNDTMIRGEVIPRDIEGTTWASLLAYFRMDISSSNTISNRATPTANSTFAHAYNSTAFGIQEAPMPFTTSVENTLDVAVSRNNFVNGADALAYSWAIIHIAHNISIPFNQTALGMIIDADVTVKINNDNKLVNTWYLKLDGKLDLQGKSQLIQTMNSELDVASSGYIERDQQGQSNRYSYNYWSSPVGIINDTSNNNAYTVSDVLRDATDAQNLQQINWSDGLDGEPTTPVTLSGFWIFKFQNLAPTYANWTAIGPYGSLLPGQGFTLKGSTPTSGEQDFAFVGKPNNGTISSPIAPGNLNLTGNPYPSALDANAFLLANSSAINGTIYFWENSEANDTHLLIDYQGGYATKNLVGGTPPVSVAGNSDAQKIPGRFIPVGQGFFVKGNSAGGNLTFTNSQRAFMKEDSGSSTSIFRQDENHPNVQLYDNDNDEVVSDSFARIRLGFDAPNNFHRQTLIGFMNEHASSGMNAGYDALNIDTLPYDMYLMIGSNKLVISGEGYFDKNKIYPIGVKSPTASAINFTLDGTENFDENQDIFIHDNTTGTYHNLRNGAFTVNVPAGIVTNRFTLRFVDPTALSNTNFHANGAIGISFTSANKMLVIENSEPNTKAETIVLYNMLGQTVASWNIANQNQTKLQIPIVDVHAGTYIVKMHTTNGDISKKIIIQ